MSAKYIDIVSPKQVRDCLRRVFASHGEKIVELTPKAFDIVLTAVQNWSCPEHLS